MQNCNTYQILRNSPILNFHEHQLFPKSEKTCETTSVQSIVVQATAKHRLSLFSGHKARN